MSAPNPKDAASSTGMPPLCDSGVAPATRFLTPESASAIGTIMAERNCDFSNAMSLSGTSKPELLANGLVIAYDPYQSWDRGSQPDNKMDDDRPRELVEPPFIVYTDKTPIIRAETLRLVAGVPDMRDQPKASINDGPLVQCTGAVHLLKPPMGPFGVPAYAAADILSPDPSHATHASRGPYCPDVHTAVLVRWPGGYPAEWRRNAILTRIAWDVSVMLGGVLCPLVHRCNMGHGNAHPDASPPSFCLGGTMPEPLRAPSHPVCPLAMSPLMHEIGECREHFAPGWGTDVDDWGAPSEFFMAWAPTTEALDAAFEPVTGVMKPVVMRSLMLAFNRRVHEDIASDAREEMNIEDKVLVGVINVSRTHVL